MGAAAASQVPVSRVGEPPLAWTGLVEEHCDQHRLNAKRLGRCVQSPSLVVAGEKPGLASGRQEGPGLGVPSSCCREATVEVAGRWQPASLPHSFGAGCRGFHHVTHILPIQGNSCPFAQLLAGSIQVKWSTGGTRVDYLVPSEATADPLGQALVASHS